MWKLANLYLKSSRLVAEMTLLGSRFHRGIKWSLPKDFPWLQLMSYSPGKVLLSDLIYYIFIAESTDTTHLIGNAVTATSSTNQHNGSVFLLDNPVEERGVLFAFSGYFVNQKTACFQIWRPVDAASGRFLLLKEEHFRPTVTEDSREDVSTLRL